MFCFFGFLVFTLLPMNGKLIAAGIIGFAALKFLGGQKQAADSITYSVAKVDWTKKNKTFLISLRLANPSSSAVVVDNINGVVSWNGNQFGSLTKFDKTTIAAGGETTVNLSVKPNAIEALGILSDLFSKGGVKKVINGTFKLAANISSLGLLFPVNYEKNFKLV